MAWDSTTNSFTTVCNSQESEEALAKKEIRIHRGASAQDWQKTRANLSETKINGLRCEPEYESIEAFVQFKLDDETTEFTFEEVHALARVADYRVRRLPQALPPTHLVQAVREQLIAYGLKPKSREVERHFRGAMSNAHGANPHAGFGGGGTGMGTDKEGPTGFGFGGGPGAMGGGYKWEKNDSRNLKMC